MQLKIYEDEGHSFGKWEDVSITSSECRTS